MLVTARYGEMRYVADFTCDVANVRRGTKCVLTTDRGTEMGEILVTNKERPMESRPRAEGERRSEYDKPGISGHVLRVATAGDLQEARRLRLEEEAKEYDFCAAKITELKLKMSLVCAEHLLGGEKIVFYFLSEERIDFRDLVKELQGQFRARIELRQVGARDSARMVGDYNTCGQQLCCQTFIKDFEPITMKMAKTQRTTLDPEKISGRCGKLKCCLRYENDVYIELKKLLPNIGAKVKTKKGPGEVVDQNVIGQEVMLALETGEWVRCWGSDVLEIVTPGTADAPPKRRPRLPPPGADDDKRGGPRRDRPGLKPGASPAAGVAPAVAAPAAAGVSPVVGVPGQAPVEDAEKSPSTTRAPRGGGQSPDVMKPGDVDVANIAAELAKAPTVPPPQPAATPGRADERRDGRRWDRGDRGPRGPRPPGQGGGPRPEGSHGRPNQDRPAGPARTDGAPAGGGPRPAGGDRDRRERWRDRRDRDRKGRPPQGGPPGTGMPPTGAPPAASPSPSQVPSGPGGPPPAPGAPGQRSIREHRRRRGGRGRRHGGAPPHGQPPAGGPPPQGGPPQSPPPTTSTGPSAP